MSSVFGFFNSFTSFSPFWCCRRVLAERPVDTEPFSAPVSFALQADTDARTQSVLKRGRYRNTGWGDTWSERRVEVSAHQTKAQEPSGDPVNSTWPHAVRSGTSLAGRRGLLVTGRRPSSPGSQSRRSCTCRTKFSASFQTPRLANTTFQTGPWRFSTGESCIAATFCSQLFYTLE